MAIDTNTPLATQLKQTQAEVSELTSQLKQAKFLQESFMACMSHELRTPLNSILGLTEAHTERIYGELNEAQVETLGGIERGGRDLLELINNILDLTRIAGGEMPIEMTPFSVGEMCHSCVKAFEERARSENIQLTANLESTIGMMTGDELRIRQMLSHLLDNAIKFTNTNGSVALDAALDREAQMIHIAVSDTGVGIPRESLPDLFAAFQQIDGSIRREHSGTGLGLTLVSQLAELHGGSVSVESELGEGSRFIITLPLGEAQDSPVCENPGHPEVVEIKKALVVEDSEAAADQICRYLGERGIETSICPRGDEALSTTAHYEPDIIILDIQLPGLLGWEVMERLKANPRTRHIPIMIVSIVDERQRALSLGASEYLVKPINRNQLSYALCKLMASCASTPDNITKLGNKHNSTATDDDVRPHILLAEDNEANIKTLTDYLGAKGYRVSVARDGIEAINQTNALFPDLILMDIQMPNLNGIEAMEKIRADEEIPNIPTVALTALAMPGDRERCLAAGACDYLSKPVSLKALNAVIEKFLSERSCAQIPA